MLFAAGYLFGVVGWIASPTLGYMDDPDVDSRPNAQAPKQPAYRVAFSQKDLWEGYSGSDKDTLQIEVRHGTSGECLPGD